MRKAGLRQRLAGQPLQLLLALLERPGEIVTRDELRQRIWPGNTFVDYDLALKKAVNRLREVLGDSAESPHFIETVPRRGYRFIGSLTRPSITSESGERRPASETPSPPVPDSRNRLRFFQRLIAGFVLLALAGILLWFNADKLRTRIFARPRSPEIHSIAVLPLENLSHDPEQQYFADGMTDALITDLAKIHALRVISRNSIMQYKGNPKPMPQIARELNVDAVVEGTVMRSGDRVRITAQLIEAPKDRHLWAETYEGSLRDVLSLQGEVAKAVAGQVRVQLTAQERTQLSNARQVDPVAHQAYLRGLYALHDTTPVGKQKAIAYFQEVLAQDPGDALAYAGMARAYSSVSAHYEAPTEVMPKARAAAAKAIELDETVADAHATLGFVNLAFDWNWPGAERELHRALELNPNLAVAHVYYAEYLLLVPHRVDEGVQEFRRAYDLDPLVPHAHGDLVWFLFVSRRYSEAVDEAAKELVDDSPFLALSYAELGRREEALAVTDRAAKNVTAPILMAQTASAYALAGNTTRAHELLARIEKEAGKRYVCGENMGAVYSALGDKNEALAWLEKGYRDRST